MSRLPVAAGLVLGAFADDLFGDPRRGHPVAGFGTAASALERHTYGDSRAAGAIFTASSVLPVVVAGYAAERALARRPLLLTSVMAAATWTVLGGRSLRGLGSQLGAHLCEGDAAAARSLVPSLCGRDPDSLDEAGLARATVESIAENTSDSVVAPLFWGALAGLPGLLGYRAINTLDAMVGHRSPRYARFGTVAARTDDVANLAPARLTALLTVAGAHTVDGFARDSWRAWRTDAHKHPSPNAGQCEAATAGALNLTLGGPTVYGARTENRPLLGSGRPPAVTDIDRAVRLARFVQTRAVAGLAGAVALAGYAGRRRAA